MKNIEQETSTAIMKQLDPQALIQAAVEHGAGIETLERLVALAKDVRAQQAKQAWHVAMAQFQSTCPAIRKTETAQIATRTGPGYSYSYAPLGEIMSTIVPIMGPLGLSISYRVRYEQDQVMANCRISHEFGHHEESGEVAMPITLSDDGKGANPAQRVGIASTYAKRYALLAIIGLTPEDDPDARVSPPAKAPTMPQRKSEAEKPGDGKSEQIVSEPQAKRFLAICHQSGVPEETWRARLASYQYGSAFLVKRIHYDALCKWAEEWKSAGNPDYGQGSDPDPFA